MSIKTSSEAVDAENVEIVARAVSEKRRAGVPIVGEVYPAGHEDLTPEERHDQIAIGCRIVAELGVDLVKTFHTGERFAEIVESTPVPILALGSKKLPRERDALALAGEAIRAGAKGVVFGRNLIQSRDPETFLKALLAVVKDRADAVEIADRLGLD
jgi:DhnA family fructose-bisphosphate aldolase class Ia